MRFEISERVTTTRSDKEIFAVLHEQFNKVARRVDIQDKRLKATALEASFGSINRNDDTIVSIKQVDRGCLLVADVHYRPSIAFWVFFLLGLPSGVGWVIPIIFYMIQKKTVNQAIRSCFERVKNEFEQLGTYAAPSASSLADAIEQLGRLKERGLLTEEEFTLKKQSLLTQDHFSGQQQLASIPGSSAVDTRSAQGGTSNMVHVASTFELDTPPGVKGWSWGGFFLSFIWAIPNKTWIGLLALVPVIGLPIPFLLGIKGREWAWRNRQWDSVEHFNRVQRQWAVWGVIFYLVALSLVIVGKAYPLIEAKLNPPDEKEHLSAEELKLMGAQPKLGQAAVDLAAQSASQAQAVTSASEDPAGRTSLGAQRIFEKDSDLRFTANTVAGTVSVVEDAEQNHYLAVNGSPLFKGDDATHQYPIKLFTLSSDEQALLVESSGGRGTSCETLFFFLIVKRSGELKWTPEFGSCVRDGTYVQSGNQIELTIPKIGGVSRYLLANSQVTEDGRIVQFDQSRENDPAN